MNDEHILEIVLRISRNVEEFGDANQKNGVRFCVENIRQECFFKKENGEFRVGAGERDGPVARDHVDCESIVRRDVNVRNGKKRE